MAAVVAIVGRPNIGKSTLFNRLIGSRKAIECDVEGTTRDPITALHEGENVDFLLVDTGGLEFDELAGTIEEDTQAQARIAATQADLILFCVDTKSEITRNDERAAEFLRKNVRHTPIFLVGTKADGGGHISEYPELFSLGVNAEESLAVSALHAKGLRTLLEKIEHTLEKLGHKKRFVREESDQSPPRISFLGMPNAGKSSFVNALVQRKECIVSEIAGTTRDCKEIPFHFLGNDYVLVDTAGIRRKSKIDDIIEHFAVMRSFQAALQSDVVVYLVDNSKGITAMDQKLIGELLDMKTGVIIAVNKWDLSEKGEDAQDRFRKYINRKLPFIPWAPVIFTSATEKKNIMKIFEIANGIVQMRAQKFSTGELNSFLQEVIHLHKPAGLKNMHPKMKYMTQTGINPPQFRIFGSHLDFLHWSYQRFLEHRFRDAFGFEGTGITLEYKNGTPNPYDLGGGKKNWRAVKKGNFKEENL